MIAKYRVGEIVIYHDHNGIKSVCRITACYLIALGTKGGLARNEYFSYDIAFSQNLHPLQSKGYAYRINEDKLHALQPTK